MTNEHIEKWYDLASTPLTDKVDANEKRIIELETHIHHIENHLKGVEDRISYLITENLKLVNRLLEAEISLERARNSLVRNHIPFPFTPSRLDSQT